MTESVKASEDFVVDDGEAGPFGALVRLSGLLTGMREVVGTDCIS